MESPPEHSTRRYIKLIWLVGGIVLFFVLGIILPVFNSDNRISPITKQRRNLGYIWLAIQDYTLDHDGKFPSNISQAASYPIPPEARQFHDPATGQPADWLYYPDHTKSDPPETILAASPVSVGEGNWFVRWVRYRIISTVGSSTEYIPETEFQRRLGNIPRQ